jgi:hypothetical protein
MSMNNVKLLLDMYILIQIRKYQMRTRAFTLEQTKTKEQEKTSSQYF